MSAVLLYSLLYSLYFCKVQLYFCWASEHLWNILWITQGKSADLMILWFEFAGFTRGHNISDPLHGTDSGMVSAADPVWMALLDFG